MQADNILRTFATISDGIVENPEPDVVGPRPFVWCSYACLDLFRVGKERGNVRAVELGSHAYNQMKEMGRIHRGEGLVRIGWIWFAGTVEQNGALVRYCFPAISASISRPASQWKRLSEPQITPLIADLSVRSSLLEAANFGDGEMVDRIDPAGEGRIEEVPFSKLAEMTELMTWCRDVSAEVGIRVQETFSLHGKQRPIERRFESGIALHVGPAIYVSEPGSPDAPGLSLTKLANSPTIRNSAFSLMYGDRKPVDRAPRKVVSFRPLSTRQREVASQLAGNDLAVISGAPGTGKSHVLSVLAGDAIARGESVLVAAGSAHAVDVLVDHFREVPGPPPITFGGVRHGGRLLNELAELAQVVQVGRQNMNQDPPSEVATAQDERIARLRRQLLTESHHRQLRSEQSRQVAADDLKLAGDLKTLRKLDRRVAKARSDNFVVRSSREELIRRLGRTDGFTERIDELEIISGILSGDLECEGAFEDELDALALNEAEAAREGGATLVKRWIRQVGTTETLLLDRLRRILRDDVSTRRAQLGSLQGKGLTRATPLWIGSITEIDEVLPAIPQMFDLVILDEAAQIGQIEAASALARATRAIVCGDPKQITYRSYLSKEDFERAAFGHRTDADWLSPQSRSTYHVAAGQVPVAVLDEHFRSVPQLIGFSAKHFYEDRLHVTTRTPANENATRISVSVVDGSRDGTSANSNQAEVRECLRVVQSLIDKGWNSIGLISPFRAQADALKTAIEARFALDEIESAGLRIGTVHEFQGDERDVVLISLAVGTGEDDSAWRFVNQSDLFNVMVTRARENVIVVTSNASPPGVAGNYVKWADEFSPKDLDTSLVNPWIQRVAQALELFDIPVRTGYRVGRYVIDIVAGTDTNAIAIDCHVSANHVTEHIDRAMLLRRAGWRTADAYESKWSEEPERFVRSLLGEFPEIAPEL